MTGGQHPARPDRYGACKDCGYGVGNEAKHGHTCWGKQLTKDGRTASCYDCGRTIPIGRPISLSTGANRRAGGGVGPNSDFV